MVDDPDNAPDNFFIRFRHSVDRVARRSIDSVSPRQQTHPAPEQDLPPSAQHPGSKASDPAQLRRLNRAWLIDLDPPAHQHSSSTTCTTMSSDKPSARALAPADDFDDFADPETWARHSPYSPFNLQHLPQPIPRDIQQPPDSNDFTFRDAFEDLMLASLGRPLPRGHELMAQKLHVDFMFANGMPISNWARMLQVRGLWAPYFARQQQQQQQQQLHGWDSGKLSSDILSMLLGWGADAGWLPGQTSERERGGKLQTSQKVLEDKDRQCGKNQPETEEDLYETTSHTSADKLPRYQSPWDTLFEALVGSQFSHPTSSPTEENMSMTRTDNSLERKDNAPKDNERHESHKTWDGGRVDKVWKTSEYDGKVETVETQYTYDAQGHLVSQWESTNVKTAPSTTTDSESDDGGFSASSSSSRWSRTWSSGNSERAHGDCDEYKRADSHRHDGDETEVLKGRANGQKPNGWFWTK
ncbi:hypothetical protein Micbo1qcDRAFT_166220 [Microdochium bolleyi]|uniref:Uncharacterized protein n=1 Tax=Microdochium bolleyi TaxID=196109 RepID=A0A136IVJ6_9PEZI|nr:hypothetical protein Micbo1qcDRAFT_166220 [Microdochium bolleyi]